MSFKPISFFSTHYKLTGIKVIFSLKESDIHLYMLTNNTNKSQLFKVNRPNEHNNFQFIYF